MIARFQPPATLGLVFLAFLLCTAAGCQTDSSPAPAPAARFRAMTYNLHHGEGMDGQVDLVRIAQLIRDQQVDLVALQEVDKGVARTQRRDLPAELAHLTGMTALFRNNFAFQGGEYGNAILTRFSVSHWTNTHLRMVRPNEQRGLLEATVNIHGYPLRFFSTHIDYRPDDTERLANVAQFREMLTQPTASPVVPVLLGGDFNDVPGSRTHQALAAFLTDVWPLAGQGDGFTFPSPQPRKRIDYFWIKPGTGLRPLRAWVPSTLASDHLPVVAEFELETPAPARAARPAPSYGGFSQRTR